MCYYCDFIHTKTSGSVFADFSILEKIPTPTFSFGGQTGNRESVLILQKKMIQDNRC